MRARTLPLLAILLAFATLPAAAQDLGRVQMHFGDSVFQLYCAICHGEDGKGDGPAASALNMPPADLTTLAQRNGGTFPARRVRAILDSLLDVAGHTSVALPPWAQLFAREFETFAEGPILDALVARRVDHILDYLESIQVD